MLDLRTIVVKYPQSINSRSQLASVLHDLYPAEKRAVNIALIIYDAGIATKISELKKLDVVQQSAFVSTLVDEYGLQEQYAAEGIIAWAQAYNLPYAGIRQQGNIHGNIGSTKIAHNPDAYAKAGQVVTGILSDYELESLSNGVVITKFRGFDETDLVVPNIIDGRKVVGIGKFAYMSCSSAKTVTISDGIEFIEDGAFAKCEKLETVVFPETLKRIGSTRKERFDILHRPPAEGVFEDCAIKSIALPNNLSYLGNKTFLRCRSLTSVELPNSITAIEDSTFFLCAALKEITLPEKLRRIADFAFAYCGSLADIQFPLSLEEIGKFSFRDCPVRSIVLNEGLEKIGGGAFVNCTQLTEIVLPSTFKQVDEQWAGRKYELFGNEVEMKVGRERIKLIKKNELLTVYCYSGTFGLEYAREKGYSVKNASAFTG